MAATAEGAALTKKYLKDQLAVRASVTAELEVLWSLLDPRALNDSFPRYFAAAAPVVKDARHRMESLTSRYYTSFRAAEGVEGLAPPVDLSQLEPERLLTSLLVTGPTAVKTAVGQGVPLNLAMKYGFVAQAGAAGRLALDAGRSSLDRQVRADDAARGWFRVTHGSKPCAFCAMLASRGAVYKSRKSAGDGHRYHDHCSCTVEPIFSAKSVMTPQSERYREIWDSSTKGLSGSDAFNAFRKVIDSK
jgi:hypothetical protein